MDDLGQILFPEDSALGGVTFATGGEQKPVVEEKGHVAESVSDGLLKAIGMCLASFWPRMRAKRPRKARYRS